MNTTKKGILHLAEICARKGVREVVFSPGSRNAPMVIAFNNHPEINCRTIVDERSAAFFALGLAQQSRKPVAIVCTSGSAVLNYAPAISEAYYQEIPLLVLTSDRPQEWVDQGDMQTIRQHDIFRNYIKGSYTLPQSPDNDDELWHNDRIINEAINTCLVNSPGPVHINIPLTEPLYDLEDVGKTQVKIIEQSPANKTLDDALCAALLKEWKSHDKVMVISGLMNRDQQLQEQLSYLAAEQSVAVFTETTSNLHNQRFLPGIDRIINTTSESEREALRPDLVITVGGYIVSKKVKLYLRKYRPKAHWHIDPAGKTWDTFQSLTRVIKATPSSVFALLSSAKRSSSTYGDSLQDKDQQIIAATTSYLDSLDFCDFTAFREILSRLPAKSQLQLGNSTPVRYSNLFNLRDDIDVFSNRGVGGIDGSVSTAVGAANATEQTVCLIAGDLSFCYDSNGLWNKYLPKNLKIIVINNGGGNIFRIIDGPTNSGYLEEFFETQNNANIKSLVEAFKVAYASCADAANLQKELSNFFQLDKTAVLEIKTNGDKSARALKDYFSFVQSKIS